MAALTTIAVGLLVTSLVLGAVSVATTVIAAKTGNKTLKKIGKISGYASMAAGVAGAGVGIAAAAGTAAATTAGTQAATQGGKQAAIQGGKQAAIQGGKTAAMEGAAAGGKAAITPAVTGTVATPSGAAGTNVGLAKGGSAIIGQVNGSAAPVATKGVIGQVGQAAIPVANEGLSQANAAAQKAAVVPQAVEPVVSIDGVANTKVLPSNVYGPDEIGAQGNSIINRPELIPEKSWIGSWMNNASEKVGAAADKVGEFATKNPMATYGIIATLGSGLGGLFEADVADAKLKQEQRQFQAIQDRQNAPLARNF